METMKSICEDAIKTEKQFTDALLLDVMLQEMEEEHGLLDGLPIEAWLL